jgi:hypothetical protein
MILRNKTFLIGLLLFLVADVSAQSLKVTLSPDERKVNRNTKNGVSTVVFDSKVKGLSIDNGTDDQWMKPSDNMCVYLIDTQKDLARGYELSQRTFILNSPKSAEYLLEIEEILPNQVLYYTVVLPEQYPNSLSCEYIYSKTAMYGIRVSYGNRFGFFLSYKCGEYKKQGTDISIITQDFDITHANKLGYIRTAITGGLRLGVMNKNITSLYVLIGGGYGEYGRQWENPLEVNNNTLFYSDYIKGFEGEIACQCVLYDWLSISLGTNMVVGNGNISVDYQVGIGLNLNFDNFFNKRKI